MPNTKSSFLLLVCSSGGGRTCSSAGILFPTRMTQDGYGIGWLCLAALVAALLVRLVQYSGGCWHKMRVQSLMKKQGIVGPPLNMRNVLIGHGYEMAEAAKAALQTDLPVGCHNIEPRVQRFTWRARKEYGNPFVFWWGVDAVLGTTDVNLLRIVMSTKFYSFGPSEQLKKNRQQIFGSTGIVVQQGEAWAKLRAMIVPAFHLDRLKGMLDTIMACTSEVIDEWNRAVDRAGGSAEIDVADGCGKVAADILARTSFGTDYSAAKKVFSWSAELALLNRNNAYYSAIPLYRYLPTQRNKHIARTKKAIEQELRVTIQDRLQAGQGAAGPAELLDFIIRASELFGTPGNVSATSLQYILDECSTFYIVGQETTSAMLQWTMMLLALHPEWQEKARAEVDEVTQGQTSFTAEMTSKLQVVTMVLLESLRLYPATTNVVRQAVEDVQAGDIFIPKGVCVYVSVLAMHTMPELWGQDALQFKPERFENGVRHACKMPTAYIPFSTGPRTCPGQPFAMQVMKAVIGRIVQTFRFSLSPSYRHSPHVPMLLQPQFGIPLIISKRS